MFVLHNFQSFLGFAMQLEEQHDTQKSAIRLYVDHFFINGHCVFYNVFEIRNFKHNTVEVNTELGLLERKTYLDP